MSGPSASDPTADRERGLLLVISGPSGTGKSTLVREIVRQGEFPITVSVSVTSRPPRNGERDGVDYQFVSREELTAMAARGELLEHAVVHGNLYGTPRQPVEEALAAGRWVVLEIDVQGYNQVRRRLPEAIGFFVRTPSLAVYEQRLRQRATESEEQIQRRLSDAHEQLDQAGSYEYQIVNETLPQAVRTLRTLLWGLRSMGKERHD